jgi:CheY-like chemotaxis protein
MDIMMPKMDGLTACHVIKKDPATKAIPVVMVTAIGFELNIKLSQQMGATGYVTKPFSPQDLVGKITEVLANRPVVSMSEQL